jgi:hypothetical protein
MKTHQSKPFVRRRQMFPVGLRYSDHLDAPLGPLDSDLPIRGLGSLLTFMPITEFRDRLYLP